MAMPVLTFRMVTFAPTTAASVESVESELIALRAEEVNAGRWKNDQTLAKLQAYKKRMSWRFPWASSLGSDFNSAYGVGFTEEEQQRKSGIEYNYCREDAWKASGPFERNVWGSGVDKATFLRERPGMSAFILEDGVVYHTYSTYARGVDALWGMWQWLDRAPKGRNETGHWWRRHDEYESSSARGGE